MTLMGVLFLMFWVNPQLAVVTAFIVPLGAWVSLYYGGKMTITWRRIFSGVGDFNARIEETVGGIRVVKAFANEEHERSLFAQDNENYHGTKFLGGLESRRPLATAFLT